MALARSSLKLATPLLAVADDAVTVEQLATADILWVTKVTWILTLLTSTHSPASSLFRPALEDYDVVIHLKRDANPKRFQELETTLVVRGDRGAFRCGH